MKIRQSNTKAVLNRKLHNDNYTKYIKIVQKLLKKFKIKKSNEYNKLVNFSTSKKETLQNWFLYKQGYSTELVSRILNKKKLKKSSFILDPFCGVGTTNVVCNNYGYKNIGIDVNPIAILAAKVKNRNYNEKFINDLKRLVKQFKLVKPKFIPDSKVIQTSFNYNNFKTLMYIKGFCENIKDIKKKEFFLLAYISIIEECSYKIKDGNGLKNYKNKKIPKDIVQHFKKKLKKMISEINNIKKNSTFIEGSFLDLKINKKFDLVIFSPPYANCFDYFEVYKLEMWMSGIVNEYKDFERYRSKAFRSHVNSKFNQKIKYEDDDINIIANLISSFNIWNKNIPAMIRCYFDDTRILLNKIFSMLKSNSSCFIIVANSAYKGVIIPTDLIIAQIATKLGFKVKEITYARKIRSSSQQNFELKKLDNNLMRETIIEIIK